MTGSVDPNTVGEYPLTYTVNDGQGQSASVTRTVHVTDTLPPTIALNGPAEVTVECHSSYTELGATGTDQCAGVLTPVLTGSVDPDTVGDYPLTYTVNDGQGQSASVTRTVHVTDTLPPTIALNGPAEVTVECHSSYTELGATGTDQCAGVLTPVLTGSVDPDTVGDYPLTYTVNDGQGQSASVTRTVHVTDTLPPTIALNGPAEVTVECHSSYIELGATGTDQCAGVLTPVLTGSVDPNTMGDYPLTYTVNDGKGQSASVTRTVHVTDTLPPAIVLNCAAELMVECHSSNTELGATANDQCAGVLTPVLTGSVDPNTVGDYPLTYTVNDGQGQSASVTRTVHVTDTLPPGIVLNGPAEVTVECHSSYTELGATGTDQCAGVLTPVMTGSVDPNTVGEYPLTYTVSDSQGQSASVTRTVHVTDTLPPAIALNGPAEVTVECHSSYTELGATGTDQCAGVLTPVMTGSVDPNTVGEYPLTYTVSDSQGQSASVTRTVHVTDTLPPSIDLNGPAEVTVECHSSYAELGATGSDQCAGVLTPVLTGSVDPNTVGEYPLTYTVSDSQGQSASVTRTVHVTDTLPPTIVLNGPAEVTVECHSSYTELGATGTDQCAGVLTPVLTGSVDPNTVGEYPLTYTVSDGQG